MTFEEEIKSLKAELAEAKVKAGEKEALEREFNASKKRFETIFDESSVGKKIIDSNLQIVRVNKALVNILQYSEQELLGANILNLSHPDFKEEWGVLRDELWKNDRQNFSIDTCLIKKDKTPIWCHVTSIVFEDHGKTLGYTIIEDISQKKQLEELERQVRENELLIRQQDEIFRATINAQERERERIAEGLHNSLGQLLFAAQIHLNLVNFKNQEETDLTALKKTEELLQKSMKECRLISHQLMPLILHDFGLKAAIKSICRDISGIVSFSCDIQLVNNKNDKYFEIIVYRLVQELMLNIGKHSGASKGRVSIIENEREIVITVEDNGKGFVMHEVKEEGIGLSSIRNNVRLLKGEFQVNSIPGNGTTIIVRLPNS